MLNTIVDDTVTLAKPFDTTINVAAAKVSAGSLVDGTLTVELDHGDEGDIKTYTPEIACALAAALQAVAIYQLEQQPRELHRTTEPGEPAHEGVGGGL